MSTRTSDPRAAMAHLHSIWNSVTGQTLPLIVCDYAREFGYHQFIQAGFGEKDIMTVVRYLQREIRQERRQPAALRWSNCIGNITRFAEDLELARGALRNAKPPPTPKERAIACLRPTVAQSGPLEQKVTARPVGDYIRALREAAR